MAGFITIYSRIAASISAILGVWGMTCRTSCETPDPAFMSRSPKMAGGAELSEMAVSQTKLTIRGSFRSNGLQTSRSVRNPFDAKFGLAVLFDSPLKTQYADYSRIGRHDGTRDIVGPVQNVILTF
jgi:hypothetical protein